VTRIDSAPAFASFETCQHGTDRALGRNEARRRKTSEQVFAEIADLGVELLVKTDRRFVQHGRPNMVILRIPIFQPAVRA
jgi:RNA-splicing ligase RtcB